MTPESGRTEVLSVANANVLQLPVNKTIQPFYIITVVSITFSLLMTDA